jgi:hypothetical protein
MRKISKILKILIYRAGYRAGITVFLFCVHIRRGALFFLAKSDKIGLYENDKNCFSF